MTLPSKELLSKVLNVEITYLTDRLDGNLMPYQVARQEGWSTINIYEFAHRCKEWAWDKHRYKLKSGIFIGRKGALKQNEYACTDYESISENANSEPEAIFKACEWILKEIR